MTLHEAIEKVLLQSRTSTSMTARALADELNKNKWYVKGDNSTIKPSQITARANDHPDLFEINRSLQPLEIGLVKRGHLKKPLENPISSQKIKISSQITNDQSSHIKTSFDPISNEDTMVLILGTMPGDKSLQILEYYGHPRNRFWKIISEITGRKLPNNYPEKKHLLLESNIGVWDVAHKADRKGSLDRAILNERPNDLDGFINRHKHLKTIAFNGTKAQTLFDKYFVRRSNINYILLPSSSPANTGIDFERICEKWREILG